LKGFKVKSFDFGFVIGVILVGFSGSNKRKIEGDWIGIGLEFVRIEQNALLKSFSGIHIVIIVRCSVDKLKFLL
jgi:hypothetical protein